MAAGSNRRLQQTQHQVDEVKFQSESASIIVLQETCVTRRDVLAKAISPLCSEGGAQHRSICFVMLVSSQLMQRRKEMKMHSAGVGEQRAVVSPQRLSADPVLRVWHKSR